MLVGYARVSTDGQNLDRQIDALKADPFMPMDIFGDFKKGKKEKASD